jgi:hypothetical protein
MRYEDYKKRIEQCRGCIHYASDIKYCYNYKTLIFKLGRRFKCRKTRETQKLRWY